MTRSVAFLVGIDQFSDPKLPPLRFCQNDVSDMERVLSDRDICGFETTAVRNEEHHSVLAKLERSVAELRIGDKILVYYAGHGRRSRRSGKLYLAATNTQTDALNATAIPVETVIDILRESNCSQRVLILDCCYSGAVGAMFRGGEVSDNLGDLARSTGIYILTASTATQTAEERESVAGIEGNGVFTRSLIHGLESGNAPTASDGETITVDGLYDFVFSEVVSNSQQQPQRFLLEGTGNIVLARSRASKWNKRRGDVREKFLEMFRSQAISADQLAIVLKLSAQDWKELSPEQRRVCTKAMGVLDGQVAATEVFNNDSETIDRREKPLVRTGATQVKPGMEEPDGTDVATRPRVGSASISDSEEESVIIRLFNIGLVFGLCFTTALMMPNVPTLFLYWAQGWSHEADLTVFLGALPPLALALITLSANRPLRLRTVAFRPDDRTLFNLRAFMTWILLPTSIGGVFLAVAILTEPLMIDSFAGILRSIIMISLIYSMSWIMGLAFGNKTANWTRRFVLWTISGAVAGLNMAVGVEWYHEYSPEGWECQVLASLGITWIISSLCVSNVFFVSLSKGADAIERMRTTAWLWKSAIVWSALSFCALFGPFLYHLLAKPFFFSVGVATGAIWLKFGRNSVNSPEATSKWAKWWPSEGILTIAVSIFLIWAGVLLSAGIREILGAVEMQLDLAGAELKLVLSLAAIVVCVTLAVGASRATSVNVFVGLHQLATRVHLIR